ncbi:hypothetical protein [Neisseria lactamica]|uniref:Pilus assembly protein PilS n=1 Tax=Neisseria lactamica TaxID=486 RepID=A0AAU8VV29_NEILA|nr:hypothetical protein [Neisseria lactamica]ARB05279.1 hypothetical protein B2G52_10770 [Neisseria lactamica]
MSAPVLKPHRLEPSERISAFKLFHSGRKPGPCAISHFPERAGLKHGVSFPPAEPRTGADRLAVRIYRTPPPHGHFRHRASDGIRSGGQGRTL